MPYLIIATIFAVQRLRRHRVNLAGLIAGILLFSVVISPFSPVAQGRISGLSYNEGFPIVTTHDGILDDAIGLIPPNASVLTQNNLFPQVSNRANAYVFISNNTTRIQYVLADSESSWYSTKIWGTQSMKGWLAYFIALGTYGVVVDDNGVILLENNYTGPVVLAGRTNYSFDYQNLDLYSGMRQSDANSESGTVLVHTSSDPNGVTFWYGPYASLPPGKYEVTFNLMSNSATNGSLILEASDFVNSSSASTLSQRELNQTSFASPNTWTSFSLVFSLTPQESMTGLLEFKGADVFGGPFYLDFIQVTYLSSSAG